MNDRTWVSITLRIARVCGHNRRINVETNQNGDVRLWVNRSSVTDHAINQTLSSIESWPAPGDVVQVGVTVLPQYDRHILWASLSSLACGTACCSGTSTIKGILK